MQNSDLDQVHKLEAQLFPNPWPKAFFVTDLNLPQCVGLVVECDAMLVAYAMASLNDGTCHVTNVAVAQDHQRQGLGSRLILMIEAEARRTKCLNAYLEVRTDNKKAIAMYETLGYIITATRNGYYIDGGDAFVMEKELA